jgi:hypothetical protein
MLKIIKHRFSVRGTFGMKVKVIIALAIIFFGVIGFGSRHAVEAKPSLQEPYCQEPHLDVATPLNDLGGDVYIRMDGQDTGEIGGLYPGGSNVRPPEHEADGLAVAEQIVPLDADGNPDDVNGKIVMISIGMSNTSMEFITFIRVAGLDPDVNPQLVLVNGAQHGRTADAWVDPNGEPWQNVYQYLSDKGVTPAQVEVAWVKLTHYFSGDFPEWPMNLQADLEIVTRNLKTNFPNIKIAYYSSRTRAYLYWDGINPEPSAYESGFSVRWMIEKQINGDPSLNFDPADGEVVAPYLSWGAYLWIDGENPRSDGRVWLQEDLGDDCIHPSLQGRFKAADMLMEFFKSDTTTVGWFLENLPEPQATPVEYLPVIFNASISRETALGLSLSMLAIGIFTVYLIRFRNR